ncbi:MAG TPA: Vms1/Ankzf1 family peptidyl-tRNA hydrolase [Solirubrobacterales bacterium]|nr:Vms1/Ankzf1 family peptidyl-tRNA hydrolase [Solirubrobacterales bacterium]
MQAPAISRDSLRDLCRARAEDGAGLSVVFDLDPERFATPPARQSEVRSVLDGAHKRAVERGARRRVEELLEQARVALADSGAYDGAHGLALFAGFDGTGAEPTVLRLPEPPAGPDVEVDHFPLVRPLARCTSDTRWAVVLVGREEGRVLLGDRFRLVDAENLRETAHGRHDQGGWSQARYQRAVDEEAREHYDRIAAELDRLLAAGRYERLLIGGTEENAAGLRERLPEPAGEVMTATFAIDVGSANPDRVLEAAGGSMAEWEGRVLDEAMARLREQLGTGQAGAMGLEPTLEALTAQRVARLFVPPSLGARGTRCPRCDRLSSLDETECPLDGAELVEREEILDDAVRKAFADSAAVSVLETAADLPGGIAALTHY